MNSTSRIDPPKRILRFFRWYCDPELAEDLEGDLVEIFKLRALKNQSKAKALFVWDILRMFRPGIVK
ncbi:MAG: permease prefix domain 2-containing transporter, partial [Bacteroidota bacterium]